MRKFKPTPSDLSWAEHTLAMIADGGTLVFPNQMLIYSVDKQHKRMVLQNPEYLLDEEPQETHERTKIVFGQIGYKVEEKHSC